MSFYQTRVPADAGALPLRRVADPQLTGGQIPASDQLPRKDAEEQPFTGGKVNMGIVSMKQLLEAGVHFGHQTRRWNPKMAPYIFTERNGIHIIDLQKSVILVDEAYKAVFQIAEQGGTILFVGTKKQAQDAVKAEATRCGMYYVNERWLGGMLSAAALSAFARSSRWHRTALSKSFPRRKLPSSRRSGISSRETLAESRT